jgi:hypothetical protein
MIEIDLKTPIDCKGCTWSEVRYISNNKHPYAYCADKNVSIHGLTDIDEKPCKCKFGHVPVSKREKYNN